MMIVQRMPDNPKPISAEMLLELDGDEPGTWMASPKLDGFRRVMFYESGQWQVQAKHSGAAMKPFDKELQAQFDSIPWPDGIALDCEFMGPRHAGMPHSLYVFDLIYWQGKWLGDVPFAHRIDLLQMLMRENQKPKVRLMEYWSNPGLLDRFLQQLQNPLSEGIVVRKFDSKLVGKIGMCAESPWIFKVKFKPTKGGKE